jgi:hypothetical protein
MLAMRIFKVFVEKSSQTKWILATKSTLCFGPEPLLTMSFNIFQTFSIHFKFGLNIIDFQQVLHVTAQVAIYTKRQLDIVPRIGSYNGNFHVVV